MGLKPSNDCTNPAGPLGLGIDAGGTRTRWALARPSGEMLADGLADGFSALQIGHADGRERISNILAGMARALLPIGRPQHVHAGVTGFADDTQREQLAALMAVALGVDVRAVSLSNDMEIAYLDLFAPGEGFLVYAGTGSIGAFINAAGHFQRVGGHGGILDDGGSGVWIALQALRQIWRAEDERPGSWRDSAMAREVFARIGGSEWSASREFLYGGGFDARRGEIGRLAMAVAASADADAAAQRILMAAGVELARLAKTLATRFGPRPIALSGRVASLHPLIEQSMRAALPTGSKLVVSISEAHHAAARMAAGKAARATAGTA